MYDLRSDNLFKYNLSDNKLPEPTDADIVDRTRDDVYPKSFF